MRELAQGNMYKINFINDKNLYNSKILECYQDYIWSLIYGI